MSWYKIFYWLTVADNARSFFLAGVWVFTVIFIIASLAFIIIGTDGEVESRRTARKFMFWSGPLSAFFWLLLVFTPSKKDSLFIIAGGGALNYLTTDTLGRQIPVEMSNFVITQLRSMSKDAQVELGIQTERERILQSAKEMDVPTLLNKLQTDTTFRKLILNE